MIGAEDRASIGKAGLHGVAELLIYVIAVQDPYTFGERFTPEVEKALPAAASSIVAELAALSQLPSPVQT